MLKNKKKKPVLVFNEKKRKYDTYWHKSKTNNKLILCETFEELYTWIENNDIDIILFEDLTYFIYRDILYHSIKTRYPRTKFIIYYDPKCPFPITEEDEAYVNEMLRAPFTSQKLAKTIDRARIFS